MSRHGLAVGGEAEGPPDPDVVEGLCLHVDPDREGAGSGPARKPDPAKCWTICADTCGSLSQVMSIALERSAEVSERLVLEEPEDHAFRDRAALLVVVRVGRQGELLVRLVGLEDEGAGADGLGAEVADAAAARCAIGVGGEVAQEGRIRRLELETAPSTGRRPSPD